MMETVSANALPVQDADAALVRARATGDERALRITYARYAQRLFAYACRLTGDRAPAEEVMQDSLRTPGQARAGSVATQR